MPWSNPDYEHETPPYDPEPLDDDPWDSPYTHTDDPPDATEDDLSAEDA